ncbi:MAG: AMP-binding protein, partial [Sulfitobacter sp.]|nr:AMP-binding protein [Sulfitobacter sp.]
MSFLPTPVAEYAFSQDLEHPSLRTLLIGGDRLRQFSHERRFAVINNYGPTEATVVATSGRVRAGQPLHIGKPMANATVYLLDAQQRPVPVGVAGELYVGGRGVARGDLDGDGDQDLFVAHSDGPPGLLRNDLATGHRLVGANTTHRPSSRS